AERTLITANVRRRRRTQVIDKIAAAVMLQSFLDGRR
ncbi:MAG: Holliday junction resolvase RuvX, partial [Acidimicrobiia bacterium]|nr:Holliday junction resolvase RuvX [Acidimicrobiia bacterium]